MIVFEIILVKVKCHTRLIISNDVITVTSWRFSQKLTSCFALKYYFSDSSHPDEQNEMQKVYIGQEFAKIRPFEMIFRS